MKVTVLPRTAALPHARSQSAPRRKGIFARFRSLTVKARIMLLLTFAVASLFIISAVFLSSERHLIMEDKKLAVQQTVEIANTLMQHFHDLERAGTLTRQQAQKSLQAADEIKLWI